MQVEFFICDFLENVRVLLFDAGGVFGAGQGSTGGGGGMLGSTAFAFLGHWRRRCAGGRGFFRHNLRTIGSGCWFGAFGHGSGGRRFSRRGGGWLELGFFHPALGLFLVNGNPVCGQCGALGWGKVAAVKVADTNVHFNGRPVRFAAAELAEFGLFPKFKRGVQRVPAIQNLALVHHDWFLLAVLRDALFMRLHVFSRHHGELVGQFMGHKRALRVDVSGDEFGDFGGCSGGRGGVVAGGGVGVSHGVGWVK